MGGLLDVASGKICGNQRVAGKQPSQLQHCECANRARRISGARRQRRHRHHQSADHKRGDACVGASDRSPMIVRSKLGEQSLLELYFVRLMGEHEDDADDDNAYTRQQQQDYRKSHDAFSPKIISTEGFILSIILRSVEPDDERVSAGGDSCFAPARGGGSDLGGSMTAFILSSALAFALYELLASVKWPVSSGQIPFHWGSITVKPEVMPVALNLMRAAIVAAVLISILVIHTFTSPNDVISKYEVNVVFGFLFGPMFGIWVNSIVMHPAPDLSRVQVLAAIGLLLLFFFGAVGNETAGFIRRYSNSLSSVKIPGAELSFLAGKERNDGVSATPFAGSSANTTFPTKASPGLSNLAVLDKIIERDRDYLIKAFSPKDSAGKLPVGELYQAEQFAKASIVPPLSCLFAWYARTGDSHTVDNYLTAYVGAFRRLEALNTQINAPKGQPTQAENTERLREVSSDLVRHGLATALDVASSIAPGDLPEACKSWFAIYCPAENAESGFKFRQCLAALAKQFDPSSGVAKSDLIEKRISFLSDGLAEFITPPGTDTRGLEALPYFAITRASLMAQLGQHEAAASILDDWLRLRNDENQRKQKQDEFEANPLLQIKDEWFALRVRSTLATYVEDWLEDQGTPGATVVQTEHLKNLQLSLDGFKKRLLKAGFFKELDAACQTKCEPVFKRPAECTSDEPRDRLRLWQKLYTSYISFKYALIHRALEHPDYQSQFAETINDEARRLVNYDPSCATDQPEVFYAQSLLAFVENAASYSKIRARLDSEDTQKKRLDEAERAGKLGLEIIKTAAAEDQERTGKRYLGRIEGSFAVGVQERLKTQLRRVEQAKKQLGE
jgi:hypothetical protein